MLKLKGPVLSLLLATLIFSQAYGQQLGQDQQVRTIFGKVINIDVEGGVINVKTDHGEMAFYILVESDLLRLTHHISEVEIAKGDSLKIKYFTVSGRNKIISLVDNEPARY